MLEYELIRHGMCYPDEFQGCGVAGTGFAHVATGLGLTEEDALQDALGQMDDVEESVLDALAEEIHHLADIQDNAEQAYDPDEDDEVECLYWHVSIRWGKCEELVIYGSESDDTAQSESV